FAQLILNFSRFSQDLFDLIFDNSVSTKDNNSTEFQDSCIMSIHSLKTNRGLEVLKNVALGIQVFLSVSEKYVITGDFRPSLKERLPSGRRKAEDSAIFEAWLYAALYISQSKLQAFEEEDRPYINNIGFLKETDYFKEIEFSSYTLSCASIISKAHVTFIFSEIEKTVLTYCPSNIFIKLLTEGKAKFDPEVRSKEFTIGVVFFRNLHLDFDFRSSNSEDQDVSGKTFFHVFKIKSSTMKMAYW
ncbi:hypothetical protein STEG23_004914, partial [Scotinomys teguina]